MTKQPLISIIIPIYNEVINIPLIHKALAKQMKKLSYRFEMVFIDDGSSDGSLGAIEKIAKDDKKVQIIEFARNFGKEAAISAGLHEAKGDAAIMIDADLQHPPELLGEFIAKWRSGADVVVGVKKYSDDEGRFKKLTSDWFYKIFNFFTSTDLIPHATDYRLLDRCVLDAFDGLTERDRMTRGLIDWMGYRRQYIHFEAPARRHGEAAYGVRQLFGLAKNTFTSHSMLPLRLAGYLGALIIAVTGPLGIFMYIEKFPMNDIHNFHFTGTALLAVMTLFMVGIILICLGLVALYIERIHVEVTNRPLYIMRKRLSLKDRRPVETEEA